MDSPPPPPSSRSWSIYGRTEITQRYDILDWVGSGAYSDVYRGRRRSDGHDVALKEIHDYQSAFREIEALQVLRGALNIVHLFEYFWQEDDDAVLVLEFLPVDLASVIGDAKRHSDGGIPAGELKQWMLQILHAVDACHRSSVIHRDLEPSNLLISSEGVLKLADFGQARIHKETRFTSRGNSPLEQGSENETSLSQQPSIVLEMDTSWSERLENKTTQEVRPICEDDYLQELDGIKAKYAMDDTDKDISLQDGDTSCLATCSTCDMEDDPFKGSYSYEVAEGSEDESGGLTSCVGTRWFRAPELLYGSTNYGLEIDLWSLGCIFAEVLSLQPLFPGSSDIDQLGMIISVLGDFNEEIFPGCSKLPDYSKIFFKKVENPIGLEACLLNRSAAEVNLVRRLVCYDPAGRATTMELLNDNYFNEEPLPVPPNELRVLSAKDGHDESSPGEWCDYRDLGSDSDLEEFGGMDVMTTEKGVSI